MRKASEKRSFRIVLVLIGCCIECANGGDIRQIYSLHLSHHSLLKKEKIHIFHKIQHMGFNTTTNAEQNGITD